MHYLSDGRLLIDTNSTENLIRPVAVGRRNYLFAGSHCLSRTRSVREFSGIICFSLFKLHPLSVNLRHSGTIIYFEHMCFVHIIAVFHQILIAK